MACVVALASAQLRARTSSVDVLEQKTSKPDIAGKKAGVNRDLPQTATLPQTAAALRAAQRPGPVYLSSRQATPQATPAALQQMSASDEPSAASPRPEGISARTVVGKPRSAGRRDVCQSVLSMAKRPRHPYDTFAIASMGHPQGACGEMLAEACSRWLSCRSAVVKHLSLH